MKSRAYIGFFLLAAASGYAPADCLAQTIPDSQVVPLKKFSVAALNKRIEMVHGDRTKPLESMEPIAAVCGQLLTAYVRWTPGWLKLAPVLFR